MGFLGKVIGSGFSLIGSGAQVIGKRIEDAFSKQEKKNLEYLAQYPYKHKFIVREVKHRTDDMRFAKNIGVEQDFFTVYNAENVPILIAKPLSLSNTLKYSIIDLSTVEIAKIECKKALFSSTKQNCVIEIHNKTHALSTNVLFDKRKFSCDDNNLQINCDETGKEVRIFSQKKIVMQINKVASDLGMKWGEYVIGCTEQEYAETLIMFALGIGIMLIDSPNILDTK